MKLLMTFLLIYIFLNFLPEKYCARFLQTNTVFDINETKNKSILNIPKNTTIEIFVEANPTTGYIIYLKNYDSINKTQLQFSNIILDSTANAYMSSDYIPSKTSGGEVGVGGKYKFVLKALNDIPNLELIFSQMQPWNSSSETGKFSIILTTNPKIPILLGVSNNTNESKYYFFSYIALFFFISILL